MNRLRTQGARRARMAGLSLVELMISLTLGLLVVGGALSVFASNKATYRATESLGRVQESARVAFELMSREVREAGGTPCARNLPMANILTDTSSKWYYNFLNGVQGYDGTTALPDKAIGTAEGDRVTGTDAIQLMSAQSSGTTIVSHNATSAQFKVNTIDHDLNEGDLAIACDFREVAMFQVTNAQPGTNDTVVHNNGTTVTPGNCTKGLGVPRDCSSTNGTAYTFGANSTISKLHQTQWYVGNNGNNGRSLYQVVVTKPGTANPVVTQEIAENVEDMQITYLVSGNAAFQDATAVTAANAWNQVDAVRIVLTLKGVDKVGTDASQINRTLTHVVSLRNRSA